MRIYFLYSLFVNVFFSYNFIFLLYWRSWEKEFLKKNLFYNLNLFLVGGGIISRVFLFKIKVLFIVLFNKGGWCKGCFREYRSYIYCICLRLIVFIYLVFIYSVFFKVIERFLFKNSFFF